MRYIAKMSWYLLQCTLYLSTTIVHIMTSLTTTTDKNTLFIRISQATTITGLPSSVIKKLIHAGDIEGFKPTYKMYLVRLNSLLSFIESKKIQPSTKGAILGK